MRRSYLVALAFSVACGGGNSGTKQEAGGGADGGEIGGDGGDAGGGDGAGQEGSGGDGGGGEGGDATLGDPLTVINSVQVAGGVSAARLSDDGLSVITCESGAAVLRALDDLGTAGVADGACPTAPDRTQTIGKRTVTAEGAAGITWDGGEVDTRGPTYSIVATPDKDYVVTAGWSALYLWDLGAARGDYLRGRERLDSGPVIGAVGAGEGQVVAYGPDGLSLVKVDPAQKSPDVKVDTPFLHVICSEGGSCEGAIVLQNGGSAPLDVLSATVSGEGFTVEVEHTGFDEVPEGVLARADGIAGALISVRLAGGQPSEPLFADLVITTNDVDEPEFVIKVDAGAQPLVNNDMAPDFRLPDLKGDVYELSALRGKVVHLKFLNAICATCREAIPVLENGLWTPLRKEGAEFVSFVVHVGRQTRFAATMNEEMGVISPMVLDLDGQHFQGCTQVATGSLAYPLALLVDKEGKVRYLSADEEPTNEEWRSWIDELLVE